MIRSSPFFFWQKPGSPESQADGIGNALGTTYPGAFRIPLQSIVTRGESMSILNTVASMAKGPGASDHAQVAGGLMHELEARGGVGSLIQSFQRNGMGSFIEQWSQGNTQPNPTAIENGTQGTGLIDSIAQRTGLSPGVVRGGLAITLPLLIHHMVSNNHVTPSGAQTGNQPEPTSVLQSILQRIV